ncbi:hypothetical protein [Lacunimicrobium album]
MAAKDALIASMRELWKALASWKSHKEAFFFGYLDPYETFDVTEDEIGFYGFYKREFERYVDIRAVVLPALPYIRRCSYSDASSQSPKFCGGRPFKAQFDGIEIHGARYQRYLSLQRRIPSSSAHYYAISLLESRIQDTRLIQMFEGTTLDEQKRKIAEWSACNTHKRKKFNQEFPNFFGFPAWSEGERFLTQMTIEREMVESSSIDYFPSTVSAIDREEPSESDVTIEDGVYMRRGKKVTYDPDNLSKMLTSLKQTGKMTQKQLATVAGVESKTIDNSYSHLLKHSGCKKLDGYWYSE